MPHRRTQDPRRRGVHLAPYLGENGEDVLVVVDSRLRKRLERDVPRYIETDRFATGLLEVLNNIDPIPDRYLKIV